MCPRFLDYLYPELDSLTIANGSLKSFQSNRALFNGPVSNAFSKKIMKCMPLYTQFNVSIVYYPLRGIMRRTNNNDNIVGIKHIIKKWDQNLVKNCSKNKIKTEKTKIFSVAIITPTLTNSQNCKHRICVPTFPDIR